MAYLHPHILSHLPSHVSDTPVLSECSVFLDDTRPLRDGDSAILEWAWSASLSTLKPLVKKLHYLWKGWMFPSSVKFPQTSAPICQHPVGPTLLSAGITGSSSWDPPSCLTLTYWLAVFVINFVSLVQCFCTGSIQVFCWAKKKMTK